MIDSKDYYIPPSQEVFDDIKQASIKVWKTKGNLGGYSDDKINQIKDIKNIRDNYAFMVAMFDIHNQQLVLENLNTEEAIDLVKRLIS